MYEGLDGCPTRTARIIHFKEDIDELVLVCFIIFSNRNYDVLI